MALCPVLLCPVALKRFDTLPALLTVAALLFAFGEASWRPRSSSASPPPSRSIRSCSFRSASWRARKFATLRDPQPRLVHCRLCDPRDAFCCHLARRRGRQRTLAVRSSPAVRVVIGKRGPARPRVVAGVSVGLVSEAHSYALVGNRGTLLGLPTTLALMTGLLLVVACASARALR